MKKAKKLIALNLALVLLLSLLPGPAVAAGQTEQFLSAGKTYRFTPVVSGFYKLYTYRESYNVSSPDEFYGWGGGSSSNQTPHASVYDGETKVEPLTEWTGDSSYTCVVFLRAGVSYTVTGGEREENLSGPCILESLEPGPAAGTAETSYSQGSVLTYTPTESGWYETDVAMVYDAAGNELGQSCYLVVGRVYYIVVLVYVPMSGGIFQHVDFPSLTPEAPVRDRDIVTFTPAVAGSYTISAGAASDIVDIKIYAEGSDTPLEVKPAITGSGGSVTYYFLADVVYYIYIYIYGYELGQGRGLSVSVAEGGGMMPFTDVGQDKWYYAPILFVFEMRVMAGTGDTAFSPEKTTTRAMLMTILARLGGVNIVQTSGENWYEAGLRWAVSQGITDGSYAMDNITREQVAVMLYRHAGEPETVGSLESFSDGENVSAWAQEGMRWAVEKGILRGAGGCLYAQNTAARCEMAAMLQRYIETVVNAH